jgi:hypothetical protein
MSAWEFIITNMKYKKTNMKTKLITFTLGISIVLTLFACSGGGGIGFAGIGGSGFISSGSITGFGSVFVNGVEFDTSSTTFNIDDSGSGSQDDLAVGMIVTVNGTVNADGVTGTATSISFDDQLQGPVSNLSAPDPDGENRTFTILGTTVRISAIDTVFDVTSSLNATPFDFDSIMNSYWTEISGFFNAAGELVATRVELNATAFDTSNVTELKGTVTGFTDNSTPFGLAGLSGINIDASAATIEDLPNGLSDGISVEVKGTCSDPACNTLSATRVEGQNNFDDADKISIEGLVTNFVDNSNFKVNGISVDASNASLQPTSLALREGARVEVEGPISNNTIQALTVELRGGDAKVHATISSVDPATGNFIVTVNAQAIAITVTTATLMKGSVAVSNFVRIRGLENDSGGITATRVEVRDDDDVIVQGNLQSFIADSTIQVLGVSFIVNYNAGTGETEFEDTADVEITQDQFITLAPVGTLIKVKDRNGGGGSDPLNGVADEIEIETP